jgi:hypothetical protein
MFIHNQQVVQRVWIVLNHKSLSGKVSPKILAPRIWLTMIQRTLQILFQRAIHHGPLWGFGGLPLDDCLLDVSDIRAQCTGVSIPQTKIE